MHHYSRDSIHSVEIFIGKTNHLRMTSKGWILWLKNSLDEIAVLGLSILVLWNSLVYAGQWPRQNTDCPMLLSTKFQVDNLHFLVRGHVCWRPCFPTAGFSRFCQLTGPHVLALHHSSTGQAYTYEYSQPFTRRYRVSSKHLLLLESHAAA